MTWQISSSLMPQVMLVIHQHLRIYPPLILLAFIRNEGVRKGDSMKPVAVMMMMMPMMILTIPAAPSIFKALVIKYSGQ